MLQKMKNSSIDMLHAGKRRKVDKHQYTKLRTYNKIKTSRCSQRDDSYLSNLQSTSRTAPQPELTEDQLIDINESVRKQSISLIEQNKSLLKQIRRCQKIDRLILKKFPYLLYSEASPEQQTENEPVGSKIPTQKEIELMFQFKLALDVIDLEEHLENKQQIFKKLRGCKKREHQQDVVDALFKQKMKFLGVIYSDWKDMEEKIKVFGVQQAKTKQLMNNVVGKQKQSKKLKEKALKSLQNLEYELKQVQESAQQRKKRLRKNSCEYIQIQNGQIKSQQDIHRQVMQLKQQRKASGQELQTYLENKMLQKITIINQIQKLQRQCQRLTQKLTKC